MFTPLQVEEMIRETGGLPVLVGTIATWGHLAPADRYVFGAAGGSNRDGGTSPSGLTVSVASGLPGALIAIGSMLQVGDAVAWVRAYRDDPEGLQTRILLAERTHVVDVYRAIALGAEDAFGNERRHWQPVATEVPINLEPRSGEQAQDPGGIQDQERWEAFFPPAAGIAAGDRVRVRAGFGPARYRLDWVAPHGPAWDGRAVAVPTDEEFP